MRSPINRTRPLRKWNPWAPEKKKLEEIFTDASTPEEPSLTGHNLALFEHLHAGNSINFIQARDMGISFLNERIADLKSNHGVIIHHRSIRINGSVCIEYSLTPFE